MRRSTRLDATTLLDSLHGIAVAMCDAPDLEALCALVGRQARELLSADDVNLYLWDEDAALLRLAYGEDSGHAAMPTMTAGQGAVGRAFESGEPSVVTDYKNWPGAVPE